MKKYNLDGFDCDWEPSWLDDKNEMEKIGKQALNFFQDMAVKEGRGRFPGQTKFDQKVGGHSSLGEIEEDLFGNQTSVATFQRFDSQDGSDWVSVFGFDTYYGPDKNKISLNALQSSTGK